MTDPAERTARRSGMPRWVKVFVIVGVVVAILVVVSLVTGGHGPGRHGGPAPASSLVS